jgi:hypothetical protein
MESQLHKDHVSEIKFFSKLGRDLESLFFEEAEKRLREGW